MKMSFYKIHNPTSSGLGGATISQLKYVKLEYDRAFLTIQNLIDFKITRVDKKKKWEWIYWAKIPSERIPEVYYDYVGTLLMDKEDTNFKDNTTLKLWSNVPSFTYNYTYVLNKDGLIPDWLIPKCSRKALTDKPEIRNPLEVWHLEKYAVLFRRYIFTKGYLNIKYILQDMDENLTPDDILNAVMTQDEKVSQASKRKLKDGGDKITKKTDSMELW